MNQTNPSPSLYHFMAAATAFYERDGAPKQRTVNVLLEKAEPSITKADLMELQRSVLRRIHAENGVDPSQVNDVVILGTNMLAYLPAEVFHAMPAEEVAEAEEAEETEASPT